MHRHRLLEVAALHVLERPHLDDAGVVDQHVDPSSPRDDVPYELLRRLAVRDVADHGRRVDAAIGEILTRAIELAFDAGRDRDPRALASELARHLEGEPARAGNHDDLVTKIERARRAHAAREQRGAKRQCSSRNSRFLCLGHARAMSNPYALRWLVADG